MTNAEKTRILAQRVMGWEVRATDEGRDVAVLRKDGYEVLMYLGQIGSPVNSWFPLDNLAHAGVVLEAMRAKGWHAVMLCPAEGRHYCEFYRGPMTNRDAAPNGHESLSTAICHAALLAEGVKEQEL